jgi:hypothetical protein
MHGKRERQSLELHRAIAERLRRNPDLAARARDNLARWMTQHGDGPLLPAYREWSELLEHLSVGEIIELITEKSENATRLRQNSPFAGILSPREVWKIKQSTKEHAA